MTDDEQRIPLNRHAARVLPINPAGEVLLLHCINPSAPEAPYWVSVGGGLEPGEDERQAVVRELWEETLIRCDPADLRGPVHREVVEFAWAEYDIVQHQAYYLAEVGDHAVSFARMEAIETATTLDYRWWNLEALDTTTEYVLPNVVTAIHAAFAARSH